MRNLGRKRDQRGLSWATVTRPVERAPWSEQVQVFSMEGHRWPIEPAMEGSSLVSSAAIGGWSSLTIIPEGGAGGELALPGTYEFGNHREAYREAGQVGTLVVYDPSTPVRELPPVDHSG